MAKTIEFNYNGKDYTLEYTRKTVERMEDRGFQLDEIRNKPVTYLPLLFAGAFLAHHPSTKQALIEQIFNEMTNKDVLIEKLTEMYIAPIESLMDEPEGDEGNISWGASW